MIVLFGSMAKKGEGNDIDLAIITSSWEGDMRELDLNIGSKIRPICQKYPIDYFVIPLNLVEKYKKSPLLEVINTTGRLLYMDKESIDKLKHYNCNIHDVSDDELSFIDSIYRGRYPGEEGLLPFGDPTKDDAQKAISIARRIENV